MTSCIEECCEHNCCEFDLRNYVEVLTIPTKNNYQSKTLITTSKSSSKTTTFISTTQKTSTKTYTTTTTSTTRLVYTDLLKSSSSQTLLITTTSLSFTLFTKNSTTSTTAFYTKESYLFITKKTVLSTHKSSTTTLILQSTTISETNQNITSNNLTSQLNMLPIVGNSFWSVLNIVLISGSLIIIIAITIISYFYFKPRKPTNIIINPDMFNMTTMLPKTENIEKPADSKKIDEDFESIDLNE